MDNPCIVWVLFEFIYVFQSVAYVPVGLLILWWCVVNLCWNAQICGRGGKKAGMEKQRWFDAERLTKLSAAIPARRDRRQY